MKRHELDWVSLIAGAVFLLVAVTHLVGAATGDDPDLRWLVPAMLVGIGVAGLTGALRGSRVRPETAGPSGNVAHGDAASDDRDDTLVLGEERD